jgi:hypothetical protein
MLPPTPLMNANLVLITDASGNKTWTNQCSFAGLNNLETGTMSNLGGVVTQITGATSNCLESLIPNGANQVLGTNNSGFISWINQSTLLAHKLGDHTDTFFTSLIDGQTIRVQGGVWVNKGYFPSQVTQLTPLVNTLTITNLNINYSLDLTNIAALNITIPDASALNDGAYLTITKNSNDGKIITIQTTSGQNIGNYTFYRLISKDQSITLGAIAGPVGQGWIIVGASNGTGKPHQIYAIDQPPTTSIVINDTGNAILLCNNLVSNDLSNDISYNSVTGEITFNTGGEYMLEAERYYDHSFPAVGNIEMDIVFAYASGSGNLLSDPNLNTRILARGCSQGYTVGVINTSQNVGGMLRISAPISIETIQPVYGFIIRVSAPVGNQVNFTANALSPLNPGPISGNIRVTKIR